MCNKIILRFHVLGNILIELSVRRCRYLHILDNNWHIHKLTDTFTAHIRSFSSQPHLTPHIMYTFQRYPTDREPFQILILSPVKKS